MAQITRRHAPRQEGWAKAVVQKTPSGVQALLAVPHSQLPAPYPQAGPQSLGASRKLLKPQSTRPVARPWKFFAWPAPCAYVALPPSWRLERRNGMAPSQQLRRLPESFQSLVTDLSTGWNDLLWSYCCFDKQVDKTFDRLRKVPCSKTDQPPADHV